MIETTRVRARHAEYLRNWLAEWSLHRRMRAEDGVDDNPEFTGDVKAPQLGGMVALPQIRLLYPDCRAAWERPVYAALLDKFADDSFLAVPFSRFCTPALPGELLTSRSQPQFKVLCIWNSFAIGEERLLTGWHVDVLDEAELQDAMNIYRCLVDDCAMPVDLLMRTGPPLVSPQDPRWTYQDEELGLIAAIDGADYSSESKPIYEINETSREYRSMAAERNIDDLG